VSSTPGGIAAPFSKKISIWRSRKSAGAQVWGIYRSSSTPGRTLMIATALATGWQFQQAGRYADAGRCYHELLTQEPDHADALHLFGVLHHQSGHHQRAAELIGRAIALRPDVASYHANLAEVHRALKEPERAAECCRAALRLKPHYPEAASNLGLALHDLGRHAEAVEQFEAALEMQPDFAQAQNNRGTSLRALGKTQEPAAAPARIVDKMPGNYLYLGPIALMFSQATLIHVRRDVRDVALSCWITQFSSIRWAHDQEDLARRIRDYRRLAAHWQTVLPRPVHEVCYERLVENFEPEARRLVPACGLNWEPACPQCEVGVCPCAGAAVAEPHGQDRQACGTWRSLALNPTRPGNCIYDEACPRSPTARIGDLGLPTPGAGRESSTPPISSVSRFCSFSLSKVPECQAWFTGFRRNPGASSAGKPYGITGYVEADVH
jgi:tetratricopeptide (TPR) repeat protein